MAQLRIQAHPDPPVRRAASAGHPFDRLEHRADAMAKRSRSLEEGRRLRRAALSEPQRRSEDALHEAPRASCGASAHACLHGAGLARVKAKAATKATNTAAGMLQQGRHSARPMRATTDQGSQALKIGSILRRPLNVPSLQRAHDGGRRTCARGSAFVSPAVAGLAARLRRIM